MKGSDLMKKGLIVLLYLVVVVIITGCVRNSGFYRDIETVKIGEKSNVQINNDIVSLSIKEGTLTKNGVTAILENSSNNTIIYDDTYELEIKKDGTWYKIEAELLFNEPIWNLDGGNSKELDFNWENSYGVLDAGTYRIIKTISLENADVYEEFYVGFEFAIN